MNPLTKMYLDAAARNQTIAFRMLGHFDSGVTPTHDDWIITISFYSALHFVDAMLVEHRGQTPENHQQRNSLVRTNAVLSSISGEYNALRTASQRVRYQPIKNVPPGAVQESFDQLDEIRRHVTSHLNVH